MEKSSLAPKNMELKKKERQVKVSNQFFEFFSIFFDILTFLIIVFYFLL